ncbi:DUF6492 family protein [Cellulomonas sp. GbtcB1]|uniref:DUF6492 family protein n=1 Tax=Cellulomonas sp. GbtcB1 TaxID=2824746 RepID=UPI001C2F89F5|nr:DUF6492 family protein [Cellulomonas sp. GbtcB1]
MTAAPGSPAMLVLTPSYRPDHALCVELNRSVLRLAPPSVRHALVVPPADLDLFRPLAGPRTTVQDARAVVPRPLRKVPGLNLWLDPRAPFPPVRGWVAQQVVKLAAVAAADADLVLLADSDLVFVRPFGPRTFAPDGAVPLYRREGAVSAHLPRHVRWHEVARRLLGLPPGAEAARPDYVCWPCLWEPAVVRRMLARVEAVTGLPWAAAVGRELHVSEMVLYGVYLDEVEGRERPVPHTDDMRCPAYSDEAPLDHDGLAAFLARVRLRDVAVMVSAKSGTALDLRRRLIADRVPG